MVKESIFEETKKKKKKKKKKIKINVYNKACLSIAEDENAER